MNGSKRLPRPGFLITAFLLSLAAVSALVAGCDSFDLYDVFAPVDDGDQDASELSIIPASLVLPAGQQFTFQAEGGVPPHTWSIASGGGTIAADTGLFTAPPAEGDVVVQVADGAGHTSSSAVTVVAAANTLVISPSAANIRVGQSVTFTASGGIPGYTYALFGDGTLVDNVYTAPLTSGTATITATDSAVPPNSRAATVTVAPDNPLSITPSSVTVPVDGSVTFAGFGGVAPYSFTVTGNGAINPNTGEYSAPAFAGTDTITISDSDTPPSTSTALVTVVNPSGAGSFEIFPPAVTLFTNSSITFAAVQGVLPYTFTVTGSGTINPDTGEYTAPASAGTDTVTATDSDTPPSSENAVVTIIEPLTISPPSVSVAVNGTVDFSASGGAGGYTYAVTAGGGAVNATSGLYAAPAAPGSATVTVTDSSGNNAHAAVTITAPQPLAISPSMVTVLQSDTVLFVASGGLGGYTFSKVSGIGAVNAATGVYTAPASSGTAIIRVTDAAGTRSDATVTIVAAGALTLSPAAAVVPVNGQVTFSASGGAPPYLYSVATGPGSINATSGVYSAGPATGVAQVRVTDHDGGTATATVTIAGAGCGQTFAESEPNDSNGPPWTNVDDFTAELPPDGITLVPGCSITITGNNADDPDVFRFDPGSASFVAIIVTWAGGGNRVDFYVKDADGNKVGEADSSTAGSEALLWPVDPSPGYRYLELERKDGGPVDYTITLSGS